jgi:hypothetical protein
VLNRTRREDIVFKRPFTLKGWAEPQPAGAYAVDTEEELIEGLSFPAYRGISTTITRRAARAGALIEAIPVDPGELAKAQAADGAADESAHVGDGTPQHGPSPPARLDPRTTPTRGQEEATMRPAPTRAGPPNGLAGYVSEHRFGLLLLLCSLALAPMLAAVYGTVGFAPVWARFGLPAV